MSCVHGRSVNNVSLSKAPHLAKASCSNRVRTADAQLLLHTQHSIYSTSTKCALISTQDSRTGKSIQNEIAEQKSYPDLLFPLPPSLILQLVGLYSYIQNEQKPKERLHQLKLSSVKQDNLPVLSRVTTPMHPLSSPTGSEIVEEFGIDIVACIPPNTLVCCEE